MKKKIINGILMALLLFAATTSFVSCKDNADDIKEDIYHDIEKVRGDLNARLQTAEDNIAKLQADVQKNATAIADHEARIKALEDEVVSVKAQLADLDEKIGKNALAIDEANKRIDAIEERLDKVEAAIKGMQDFVKGIITDVYAEMTTNDIIGTFKLPGLNVYTLAAFYGANETAIESFPSVGPDYNVDVDNGSYLNANEVTGITPFTLPYDYITKAEKNAGKIFFTVHTPDMDQAVDISEYEVYLETAKGGVTPVQLSARPYTAEDANISFGWTREGEETSAIEEAVAAGANNIFVADANINAADLENSSLKFKMPIDFKNISSYKQAVKNIKNATGAKATVRAFAKEVLQQIKNFYSGNGWSNVPAQRLVVAKKTVNGRLGGMTNFGIMAAAVKPLSYNSFWELEKNAKNPVTLEQIENVVSKLAAVLLKDVPGAASLSDIDLDKLTAQTVTVVIGGTPTTVTLDKALANNLISALEAGLGVSDLKAMLKKMLSVTDTKAVSTKATDRISDYLYRFANKTIELLNTHQLTRAISPIILFEGAEGVDRLSTGMQVPAGDMQVYLTSPTEELFVPAYAKYIAVRDAKTGKLTDQAVMPGYTHGYTLHLTPGIKTVILSCVDYYGYVVTKKYVVTVK